MTGPSQAASELLRRRTTGERGSLLAERPTTLQDALAIQDAMTTLWCERFNDSIGAWKSGMPAAAAQGSVGKLVLAPIFTSTITKAARVDIWAGFNPAPVARIEPEFAFVLARDLPARSEPYRAEEIRDAVAEVHMALELVVNRYDDDARCEFPDKLADSLENQGLFLGPIVDKQLAFTARELSLTLTSSSGSRVLKGRHPAGDPAAPLYWLAEFLRARGQGLRAGQAVITGCYSEKVLEVGFDQTISLSYATSAGQNLGQIQVEFRQKG